MLYELLVTLFTLACFLLILLIMIQQGKGSMGIGSIGGGTQMLFGVSGGQDLFQKITWILGAIFIFGSLALTLMKSRERKNTRYLGSTLPITRQKSRNSNRTSQKAAPVKTEEPTATK